MRSLKRVSDRAGELAVLAGGTRSDEELKVYAAEVNQLIEQAVQTANRKWGNRFLLAGTQADQPPFVLEVDSQGRATGVTYQGNTRVAESEIAARVTVSAQTVGANETGGGPRGLLMDDRFGADFFNHLIDLRDRLSAGDRAGIAGISQSALALDEENFLFHMAQNGTVQARLEATMANATHQTENLEVRMSQEADADLPQVLVRLNQTQNAYRAALQSGATLLEQSLLDFIR
jgi:flagellar hook-associated protein 3 FlgL